MAVEGPSLSAVITRLPQIKANLAAFGVALSFAMIIESPIIMMMSAANTLVRNRYSYRKVQRFNLILNLALTVIIVLLQIKPLFRLVAIDLIALPENVAGLSRSSLLFFTLWPAAIGYRRFFQGILINSGETARVTVATAFRIATIIALAVFLPLITRLPAASIAGAALGTAVLVEAIIIRLLARDCIRKILANAESPREDLSLFALLKFYTPLAFTSVLSLAIHPMITFFASRGALPLESLAVIPVLNATNFIFRSPGLAYQEIVIATAPIRGTLPLVFRFGAILALAGLLLFFLLAFTPLASFWFGTVLGLQKDLVSLALQGARILFIFPVLESLICYMRGLFVVSRNTVPLTKAAALEITVIVMFSALAIFAFRSNGVLSYAIAISAGRAAAIFFLQRALKRNRFIQPAS